MNTIKNILIILAILSLSSFPLGCGSGGEGGLPGGNIDSNTGPLSYTGLSTQTTITENNAAKIATLALEGENSNSFSDSASNKSNDRTNVNILRGSMLLNEPVSNSIGNISINLDRSRITNKIVSEADTVNGNCGGTLTRTLNVDTITGEFTGTMTFVNYCNSKYTHRGTASVSGRASLYNGDIIKMTLSFSDLEFDYRGKTFIVQGDISYDYPNSSNSSLTANYLMKCTCNDNTYKYDNFQISVNEHSTYSTLDIKGRFYHPVHGYVDVITLVSFQKEYDDEWSNKGELLIKGGNGGKAKLIAFAFDNFAVAVDTDGDNAFDWSRIYDWDDDTDASNGQFDVSSPSPPTGLIATSASGTEINLSWIESVDNIGVKGYKVYRNGIHINTVTDISAVDTEIDAYTQYCYTVLSYDIQGNKSVQSNPACSELFVQSEQQLDEIESGGVSLGDLDNDGDLDAIVLNTYEPGRVFMNDGYGFFSDSGQRLESDSYYLGDSDILLTDIDADGDLDAFISRSSNLIKLWLNNGAGTFTDSTQNFDYSGSIVAIGDLDGDKDLDVFFAGAGIWFNNGAGVFTKTSQFIENVPCNTGAFGDVDGDGDLDAIISDSTYYYGSNALWFNDGNGIFHDSGQMFGHNRASDIELEDLDGDGDLDLFLAIHNTTAGGDTSNKIWFNDGNGNFTDSGQNIGNANTNAVALGDLDNDGDLDVFDASSGRGGGNPFNKVWINDGNGNYSDSGLELGWAFSRDVALGDIDSDGDLDAFVTNSKENTIWFNTLL